MVNTKNGEMLVYVGTYTRGESKGIYVYRLDKSSGKLEFVSAADGGNNPSYLAIHPQQRYLYAVNEVRESDGKPGGAVSAFSIDSETGELTFMNRQSAKGPGSCHLSVDRTGRYVLVANYSGGSVCVLPIHSDGRLGEATDFIQHQGSSVNPRRQGEPHAHSIIMDNANRYAFVPDLGMDKIMVYRLDFEKGKLKPGEKPWAKVKDGAGPRHFAFHPNSKYAYVINELDSTITAFTYDEAKGALEEIQMVPALPGDFSGTSHCADIHVLPSGRFLYGSNRGHDSIVIYEIDEGTGKLTYVGHESTQGEVPRGFVIDPTGNFLLAANQNTDNIVVFRIDQQTGKLTPTGHQVKVPKPVCLKIIARG